jgi:hypothetical protein
MFNSVGLVSQVFLMERIRALTLESFILSVSIMKRSGGCQGGRVGTV